MVKDLHIKYLKYAALFGLVPYMTPSVQRKHYLQAFKQQNHSHRRHHNHYHHHNLLQELHYKQTHPSHCNSNRLQRWQQIYTVTLIIANLIATLYGVIFLPFADNFIVSNLVSIMVFFVQIIAVISILLESMFTYGKYYELINNYYTVEILMKQLLQIHLCTETIRKRQRRKYIFLFVAIHGSLILSITIIAIKPYYGYFWYALIAILILRTRSIQICFYLDYIVYYLELFNVKLRALISCKIHRNYCILDIDYKYLESFEYLQNVNTIYQELYALHEKYNDLYGYSMLSLFTVVVLDIIINMYWTFLTIFEYYESYYNYITCATLLPLFVILFAMCYTGDQCEKQNNLTLVYLKRLLQTSLLTGSSTDCYNSLLQNFILQILQNPITITANSYFTVNLKSLMKILANTATYLIILLQFRKANVSEDQTNDIIFTNLTSFHEMISNNTHSFN